MAKENVPLTRALRMISPGVVTLVTSFHKDRYNVATVGWTTPLSNEPVLVGIALSPSSLSHDMIRRSGEFVINIPTLDVVRQVRYCGLNSGRDVDKFAQSGLDLEEPRAVRAPLIEQCIGHLECAVVEVFQPGDHTLFVGQVVVALAETGTFDETWLLTDREVKPLHHVGGNFFGVIEERVEITA